MAGYDSDNQAATLAGLVALANGSASIPRKYTHMIDAWKMPLNDFYKNRTRDRLPDGRLTEMAERTVKIGIETVLANGGRLTGPDDNRVLVIQPDATFVAPLEARLFPVELVVGTDVVVQTEVIGGDPDDPVSVSITGPVPPGLAVETRGGRPVIVGTPTETGEFTVNVTVANSSVNRTSKLPLVVDHHNLAMDAVRILAAVTEPTGGGSRKVEVLRDRLTREHYDSFDGENTMELDFFGYLWKQPVKITRLVLKTGPVAPNGGWFETIEVQYRDTSYRWQPVKGLKISPEYTAERAAKGNQTFTLSFRPIWTVALRVAGKPAGSAQFTSIRELEIYAE
jgi:hypothetical protein